MTPPCRLDHPAQRIWGGCEYPRQGLALPGREVKLSLICVHTFGAKPAYLVHAW